MDIGSEEGNKAIGKGGEGEIKEEQLGPSDRLSLPERVLLECGMLLLSIVIHL